MKDWFTKYEEDKEPARRNLTTDETQRYLNLQKATRRSKPEVAKKAIDELRSILNNAPKLKTPLIFYNEAQDEINNSYYEKFFKIEPVSKILKNGRSDD